MATVDSIERAEAVSLGLQIYISQRICPKCSTVGRYTLDAKCVECNRISCRLRNERRRAADPIKASINAQKKATAKERAEQKAAASDRYRKAQAARRGAIDRGERTYTGRVCPLGHAGLRYTGDGACVECAAAYSASDKKKSYDAEYFEKNRAKIVTRNSAYSRANKEKTVANAKRWTTKNAERRKAISQSYKHRRRASEKTGISGPELSAWKKAAPKICYWCGVCCKKKSVVDHYEPLAKGGKHEIGNLVISCRSCNATKSAKDPYVFAQSIGRLF